MADMITDRIRSSKAVKTYRRADDDEDADGDEGEVDEEDDVEHGEVAQRRHPIAVGLHNVRPEKGCQQDFLLVSKPHMLRSMKSNMVSLTAMASLGMKKAR